jgi:hypothetical protein
MIIQMKAGVDFASRVLTTLGLPAKSVACFAPAAVYSGFVDLPIIETGKEMLIHSEDTAPADIVGGASPGTPAVPVKSYFQSDAVSIRVRSWAAWAVASGGAQIINNVNW